MSEPTHKFIPVISKRKFVNETVVIDDTQYSECEFEHCVLVYRGGFHGLHECSYRFVTWHFEAAAQRTVELITNLASTQRDFYKALLAPLKPKPQ